MLSEPNAKPRHSAYREYAPAAVLREHVLCFWTQSVDAAGGEYSHRVLPDACIDIVFFDDRGPLIVGPWTEAFVSRLAGGANLTGVRLHPGRAAEVLGLPASELLNASAPMRDVWRKTLCAIFDGVSAGDTPTVQLGRLEAAMLRRACDVRTQDRAMRFAVRWLADNPDVRVETLSRELRLSGATSSPILGGGRIRAENVSVRAAISAAAASRFACARRDEPSSPCSGCRIFGPAAHESRSSAAFGNHANRLINPVPALSRTATLSRQINATLGERQSVSLYSRASSPLSTPVRQRSMQLRRGPPTTTSVPSRRPAFASRPCNRGSDSPQP